MYLLYGSSALSSARLPSSAPRPLRHGRKEEGSLRSVGFPQKWLDRRSLECYEVQCCCLEGREVGCGRRNAGAGCTADTPPLHPTTDEFSPQCKQNHAILTAEASRSMMRQQVNILEWNSHTRSAFRQPISHHPKEKKKFPKAKEASNPPKPNAAPTKHHCHVHIHCVVSCYVGNTIPSQQGRRKNSKNIQTVQAEQEGEKQRKEKKQKRNLHKAHQRLRSSVQVEPRTNAEVRWEVQGE